MNLACRSKWIPLALALLAPPAGAQHGQGDVVYVPTPQVVVDEMLRMAKVGPADYLIDLGSGDGRIVITAVKKHGARGFGVDLDTYLLKLANAAAKKEGVTDRARFVEQNLFETDLSPATVITSYLLPEMNLKLRPRILALKPGTRVVAHDYSMGEWDPDDDATLEVPEKTVGDPGKSYIFLWIVPARVAGRWESQIVAGGKPSVFDFAFEQNFQLIHGTVRIGDRQLKLPQFRMVGEQLTFKLEVPGAGKPAVYQFRGWARGDAIEGNVTVGDGSGQRVQPW
ncbi:MAG TPA: class I SAM-dependent methyltransferase, partial [Burkholderiales bacterium]|nr:class I SAM-dependent methyltransferase [Burkholderiales bacterium]